MPTVPSTPTASDRFEEVRRLNIEIAKLKVTRDLAWQEAENAKGAIRAVEVKVASLEMILNDLPRIIAETARETAQFVADCAKQVREASMVTEDASRILEAFEGQIEGAEKHFSDIKQEAEHVHNECVKENEKLEFKKKDLDIYRRRLEKYFAEYMPDKKIIL